MKKGALAFFVSALAIGLLAGCATPESGPHPPQKVSVKTAQDTSKFVLLDKAAVTCEGFEETRLPDGQLQVLATLRNLENRRVQVQVSCAFKDAQGFDVEDTPFETVILDAHGLEGLKFLSANDKAQRYTICARKPR
jgi:hypothetical protein